jgi:hypothetical protein
VARRWSAPRTSSPGGAGEITHAGRSPGSSNGRARRRALSSSKLAFPLRANDGASACEAVTGRVTAEQPCVRITVAGTAPDCSNDDLRMWNVEWDFHSPLVTRNSSFESLAFPFHRAGPRGRRTNQRCL